MNIVITITYRLIYVVLPGGWRTLMLGLSAQKLPSLSWLSNGACRHALKLALATVAASRRIADMRKNGEADSLLPLAEKRYSWAFRLRAYLAVNATAKTRCRYA